MFYILLICKRPTSSSKTTPVNLRSRSLRTSLKETSADMKKTEYLPKALKLTFTATRYLNRNSYFNSYKAVKNKYGSYSSFYIYCVLFHFNFLSEI